MKIPEGTVEEVVQGLLIENWAEQCRKRQLIPLFLICARTPFVDDMFQSSILSLQDQDDEDLADFLELCAKSFRSGKYQTRKH